MRLAELGFYDEHGAPGIREQAPVVEEFEQSADVVLLCRCMPILVGRRDRRRRPADPRRHRRPQARPLLLISKDATIREIHHRVKNNLQTISSLLRLQARRLANPEAKAAVAESVRRIRTIALVHETLSREPGDDVTFIEIVRPLLRLAEESLQSPDRPVEFSVAGEGGRIPARRCHPAVRRAHRADAERGRSRVPRGQRRWHGSSSLSNDGDELSIDVVDDGRGLDPSSRSRQATGLGLSIVRTLVTTELDGTITMRPAKPVDLEIVGLEPHGGDRQGTVVQLVGAAQDVNR